MKLMCALSDGGEEVIGRGVVMWDAEQDIDWRSEGFEYVLDTIGPDGQPRQSLAMHMNCFLEFFDQLSRREDGATLSLIVGDVSDVKRALTTRSDDE